MLDRVTMPSLVQQDREVQDTYPSGCRDMDTRTNDRWNEIESDAFLADVRRSKLEAGMTWEQYLRSGYFGDWDPITD